VSAACIAVNHATQRLTPRVCLVSHLTEARRAIEVAFPFKDEYLHIEQAHVDVRAHERGSVIVWELDGLVVRR